FDPDRSVAQLPRVRRRPVNSNLGTHDSGRLQLPEYVTLGGAHPGIHHLHRRPELQRSWRRASRCARSAFASADALREGPTTQGATMDRNYWLRNGATGARRVNRRRLLQYGGFSAAALATTALVGCGDDDDDTGSNTPGASATNGGGGSTPEATPTTSSVTRGGTLRFGFNRDIQGLDPAKVTDSYVGFIFVGGLYDGLINYTNDYQLGAGLAEAWETPDDTTINLTIRQG